MEINKKNNILVLGAAGFIGRHLVAQLRFQGYDCLDLAGSGVESLPRTGGVNVVEGKIDAQLLNSCRNPEIIFYLAGGSSVGRSIAEPAEEFYQTIPPLQDTLEKIRRDWESTRIIYLSSAAIYGKSASAATNTNSTLSPVSPYGLHKKIAEQMLEYYADHYNIGVSIIRPFSVYGPGLRKQLLWDALKKISVGNNSFFGNGNELRDWTYVNDLVNFMLDVGFRSQLYPRITNAGTGKATSTRDVLTMLFSLNSNNIHPQFREQPKPGDPDDLVADIIEQTEYSHFFSTPLATGLHKYIEWYKKALT